MFGIFNRRGGADIGRGPAPSPMPQQQHATPRGTDVIITTLGGGIGDYRLHDSLPKVSYPEIAPDGRLYLREYLSGFHPEITPKFCQWLFKRAKITAIEKTEEELARELERIEKLLRSEKVKFSCDNARLEIKVRKQAVQAAYHAGNTEAASEQALAFPEDAVHDDFSERRYRIQNSIRENRARSVPILNNVKARLSAAALKVYPELLAEEQKKSEECGVPFTPSALLILVGQTTWRAGELTSLEQFGIQL
jgi:hypothetical protein